MMELERFEEGVFEIFGQEQKNTTFYYENVDLNKLEKYRVFVWGVLKIYNAFISKSSLLVHPQNFIRQEERRG